ncbi:carbohydrate-binding module family 63 protein [Diplodia corticola]|uniref:Carbohydrate-binding module family 63 protein n=1 Tax=Diplodia corticola TaxID=236234 RepID=A0A1J9QW41_9PEZI|nr:carbohydrate-binding module family 63 protein [Diplodia corticola]OJD32601.1 carbohydrate-binding module family 63 protein [Diplodia corticola]
MKFTTTLAGAFAALFTSTLATPIPGTSPNPLARRANSGEATFYGGNVSGGMCSFTGYTIPSGIYGTALSDANWDTAGNCGACVKVTRPSSGKSLTAMVVDQCPGCGTNHLDLFQDGFMLLGTASEGIIDVSWDFVKCGITTPITLKNKEGTSAYWFSMQVVNSNERVKSLQVSTDGGSTWKDTTRKEYNFFENQSGFGTDTVAVKVTGVSGKTIITKDVKVSGGVTKVAASNF